MTERPPATQRTRRRPALYRTILSIAVAALVAAWLPFSVLYVSAVNKHPAVQVATSSSGQRIVTSSSGHSVLVSSPGQSARPQAPVITHVS